jgi:hypothetical protein
MDVYVSDSKWGLQEMLRYWSKCLDKANIHWSMMECNGSYDISLNADDGQVIMAIRGMSLSKITELRSTLDMVCVKHKRMSMNIKTNESLDSSCFIS